MSNEIFPEIKKELSLLVINLQGRRFRGFNMFFFSINLPRQSDIGRETVVLE
jgi:hypothetical protein